MIILPLAISAILFLSGAHAARFTITNNCPYTVWLGILTADGKPQVTTTGFELASKASNTVDIAGSWKGRFWGRTGCTTGSTGKLSCATADCASGQVTCNGAGAIPPATLAEFTLVDMEGKDTYDVSLVDGFNVPVAIAPQGGNKPNVAGPCDSTSCAADVNVACPQELAVKGADGAAVVVEFVKSGRHSVGQIFN